MKRTSSLITEAFIRLRSTSPIRSAAASPFKVDPATRKSVFFLAGRSMDSAVRAPESGGSGVKTPHQKIELLQDFLKEGPGGWEKTWEAGNTPWDLGEATPIVVHLSETGSLPKGRALVPGCGSGYDVVAMACPDRHVVGLDLSKTSIERSKKMFSSMPNSKYFSFLAEDFFTWKPPEQFDLIFDYTFLTAFPPEMRPSWAKRVEQLLKPGGELITLMFPLDDRDGGPPYSISVSDYKKILIPLGFEVASIEDNKLAVRPRKGVEKLGRWKKPFFVQSTL
ncbi:PREDICTED: probable thiol methyltransferase 2 [Tarenaya hassleriana]|uniref:probable thiol methyltransferase 2 n=1 Tax=Tarenaya hassleriana TaxID=28532 RepID=UPI00053C26C8|nr:PREDICTED: probable thiol methyltransferase 2 [Tarenaya hassleriana]